MDYSHDVSNQHENFISMKMEVEKIQLFSLYGKEGDWWLHGHGRSKLNKSYIQVIKKLN